MVETSKNTKFLIKISLIQQLLHVFTIYTARLRIDYKSYQALSPQASLKTPQLLILRAIQKFFKAETQITLCFSVIIE